MRTSSSTPKLDSSPIEHLDIVLTYLAKQHPPRFEDVFDIKSGLESALDNNQLMIVLNKLIKDGHVEYKEHEDNNSIIAAFQGHPEIVRTFIISFEGLVFIQQIGGYARQIEASRATAARIDKIEANQRETARNMEKLNRWIAFGTVAAAAIGLALLIWQVYSYYHPAPSLSNVLKK